MITTHTYESPNGHVERWTTVEHEGHPPFVRGSFGSLGREVGEALDIATDAVVNALKEGAPIVLPYAAAAVVLAFCPECLVGAALFAGGVSFGVHKEISQESTGRSFANAFADALLVGGGELEKRAARAELEKLLVRESGRQASSVVLAALIEDIESEERAAYNRR